MSHSADQSEPNLVPILDMVFQLITFFMLVINFKSSAMDVNVKVPVVGSAQPVESKDEEENALVLNIDKEGKLFVLGGEKTNIPEYVKAEGAAAQAAAGKANKDFKPGDDLPTTVVIRADKETRFNMLYRVIRECQQQGFRKFHYMAKTREDS